MITDDEKETISECARKYGARAVLLFGSASRDDKDYTDIDLAVEGIDACVFFRFYGELIRRLTKPVDLVDLSDRSPFTEHVARTGIRIFCNNRWPIKGNGYPIRLLLTGICWKPHPHEPSLPARLACACMIFSAFATSSRMVTALR